jgi:hypothetical protein
VADHPAVSTVLARDGGLHEPIAGISIALELSSARRRQRVDPVQKLALQEISRNNLKFISTSRLRPLFVREIE